MSSDAELAAAILAAPDDDVPRRTLGQRLQAAGDPRGEFILTQLDLFALRQARVELAKLAQLERRSEELVRGHGAAWAGAIASAPGVKGFSFRRGFVEQIALSAADFLAHATRLYALAPIRHLDLGEAFAVMPALAASPHLARVRGLLVTPCALGDAGASALAASPHLGQLRWLELSGCQIGMAGLEALAASAGLPALRYLGFRKNQAPDPTPRPAAIDGDRVTEMENPTLGDTLLGKYGQRAWLTAYYERARFYPPDRDDV